MPGLPSFFTPISILLYVAFLPGTTFTKCSRPVTCRLFGPCVTFQMAWNRTGYSLTFLLIHKTAGYQSLHWAHKDDVWKRAR